MSTTTTIQWTDKTWNPIRGCSIVSPGCVNCYAMKQAHRFSGEGRPYHGLTKQTKAGPQWTGVVRTLEDALLEPLTWRTPARIFVNSMSDLFHEDVPDAFIDRVFAVMGLAHEHTFQILTKRADRMRVYMERLTVSTRYDGYQDWPLLLDEQLPWLTERFGEDRMRSRCEVPDVSNAWPHPNVWLGVSVETPDYLQRIDTLKDTPAAVRFVSFEPLLEDMGGLVLDGIDWAIIGPESGPGARPGHVAWVRSILRQCRAQGVAPFVKQLGANVRDRNDAGFDGCRPTAWPIAIEERDAVEDHPNGWREDWQGAEVRIRLRDRKGGDPAEWPEDLRVREYPA